MLNLRPFFIFFFFLFTFHFLLSTPTHAANFLLDKQEAVKSGSNLESWKKEAFGGDVYIGVNALGGELPESILKGEPPPDGQISYTPSGALGVSTNLIASLYTPPASGIEYLADLKNKFLGKPAYAQGVGFQGLQPILPIWRAFRNVVYIFSSILFIMLGILIIFRVKINPQTVVGIQNAIPQLIITLVLVTFSYAIAGLLIDLSYLFQSMFIAVLYNAKGITDYNTDLVANADVLSKIVNYFKNLISNTTNTPNNFANISDPGLLKFWGLMKIAVPTWALMKIGAIIGIITGTILGAASGGTIIGALAGGALIFLILQIIILIALLKFFFGLIKAYITILLKIILAPLEIGIGAFPNSKTGFGSWMTDLVANILVFPASLVFILLIDVIVESVNGPVWTPTLLSVVGGINIIPVVVGLGGILLLPKIPELIPQVIFQLKPSPFGSAIGQSLAPVSAAGWAGAQYLSTRQQENLKYKQSQGNQGAGPTRRDRVVNVIGDFGRALSGGKVK